MQETEKVKEDEKEKLESLQERLRVIRKEENEDRGRSKNEKRSGWRDQLVHENRHS